MIACVAKSVGYCFVVAAVAVMPAVGRAQSYPFQKNTSIYHKGWIDLNKNGRMDPYENPSLSVDERVKDLISRMTLDEKTAQLVTLYGYGKVLKDAQPTREWRNEPWVDGVANIDEQLNGLRYTVVNGHDVASATPSELDWPPSRHAEALNNVQRFFVEQTRLGIPVDFTNEGIRGLKAVNATSFPVEIGQGSTWDPALIRSIGRVEGEEARALGYTNVYAPEADPARDQRWGRVPSTYGEDPYLDAKLSVAMTTGLQGEHVVSTLKHFAVYSSPAGGRDGADRTDPHVTPREVRTIFLPPFEAAIAAGALGVMSSYNDYNGIPVSGSYYFLTSILRHQWGFKGYVVTDSAALRFIYSKHHVQPSYEGAISQALVAGVNVMTNFVQPSTYLAPLREAVKDHEIPMDVINERVADVLRVKFWLGLFDHPYVDVSASNAEVRTAADQALSLRAAEESLVLLKNQGSVLPLDASKVHSILVAGPSAAMTKSLLGRYGPSGMPVSSVLDGIRTAVAKGTSVRYVKGPDVTDKDFPLSDIEPTPVSGAERAEIDQAVQAARGVDVAIVVVGEDDKTVGEGRSRVSLRLPGHQLELVQAIEATGVPTVVVLLNGQPLAINWIDAHVPAILEAWFPGAHTGQAVANALFGKYDPSGRLPITFPKTVGQIPLNFPYLPNSESYLPTDPKAQARVTGPLYPFGYGLSYTKFTFSNLKIDPSGTRLGGKIRVSVDVTNVGRQAGDEVVQLYLHERVTPVITPVRRLRGFERVALQPGQTKAVQFTLDPSDLALLNVHQHWQVVPGTFDVMIGDSSTDILQKGSFDTTAGDKVNDNKAYGL